MVLAIDATDVEIQGLNFLKRLVHQHSGSWRRITIEAELSAEELVMQAFSRLLPKYKYTVMTLDTTQLIIILPSSLMALHLKIDSFSQIALLKDHG